MGWEERNGNRYYYEKERTEDGRVVSKYIGKGEFARLVSQLNRSRRLEREMERDRFEREKEREKEERQTIDRVRDAVRALERATLLLNGYHTHKGQWRKRRE